MIKDKNIDPGASIGIDKLGFPNIISGKHTDGSLPKILWIAKGGADAAGATGVSHVGSRNEPFLTGNGTAGAMVYTVDGRGDRLIYGPGIWREDLDFGSGTGTTGVAGRMNKRDIGIYGSGGAHTGRTQIVGDSTAGGTNPTIRVRDGYLRGFILSDVEVGNEDTADADLANYLVELVTEDTGVLVATSSDEYAVLNNVDLISDTTARGGLLLTGTTMLKSYGLTVAGCIFGIAFRGSSNNNPDHCRFWDTEFFDNVTADVAAVTLPGGPAQAAVAANVDAGTLSNIKFTRAHFNDRGGTPVTNYINLPNGGTYVNVMFFPAWFARDVADDTLLAVGANVVVIGDDAAGAVNIIG